MGAKTKPKQLWETCYYWLKGCGVNVHKTYCEKEVGTHPDYPALTSVIEFLDSGGMNYHAVKADSSYIDKFNYPILAHIKLLGQEYVQIVPDAKYWDEQKEIAQSWSGIVVIPSEDPAWSTSGNTAYLRSEAKKRAIIIALCIISLALFTVTIYSAPSLLLNTFGLLSLTGILLSMLLQANELGFQSQIVKQVCNAFSESGCERVMKSSYGQGLAGITPADASLLYFATQFTLYVASCLGAPFLFSGVLKFAIIGVAVIMWSLYIQAVKLKEWCALCLGVVALLSAQAILAFFLASPLAGPISLGAFVFIASVFALFFLPVKGLIKTNITNELKLVELKRWKSDGALFVDQWRQEQVVDNSKWQHDLIIGAVYAPLCITVACNPYCNPCAKTHRALDDLIDRYNEQICVQIRLLAPSLNVNDKFTQATRAILQKAAEGLSQDMLQAVITSWFEKMDLQQWTQIWQPDNTLDVQQVLEQHRLWMAQSHIAYTPTLFLNGRKIPGRYSLEDVEYLIPQLMVLLPSASRDVSVHQ